MSSFDDQKRRFRRRLNDVLNHPWVEIGVMLLILISSFCVLVELSMVPTEPGHRRMELINDGFTYVFVVELALRFFAEQRKARFFKRYWLDVLAVIPLFRSFRILRIFRLLRLFRFGVIISRRLLKASESFRLIKVEYILVGLSIFVVVLMGAFSMRLAEGRSNADFNTLEKALWWSIMTVIGGEPIGGNPNSRLGNLITVTLMMGGLTVFAVFTGTVSAFMVNSLRNLKFGTMEIEDLERHAIVCGWNRAGFLMVDELLHDKERFKHIVIISEDDSLEHHPFFELRVDQVFLIKGDYTRIDVLKRAGLERASYALLLADSSKDERTSQDRDARTVLAAMLIEKINKSIYTVVQLLNRDNETSLRQVGVEEIIVSDEYVGNIMATVAKNRGIVSILDDLLTAKYGHQFFKCEMPEELDGVSVNEAVGILKRDYNATLLGVDLMGRSGAESIQVNPPGELILKSTHLLIIASTGPIHSKRHKHKH